MITGSIAVIIPTYNRKKFLIQAIDSILNQERPWGWTVHVIVVDDGSTDGTFPHVCRHYGTEPPAVNVARLTPRLTILRKTNGERGSARNAGARVALGTERPDWFLFFDSDDILAPNAIANFVERIAKDPRREIVAVYGAIQIWNDTRPLRIDSGIHKSPEGDLSKYLLDQTILPLGATLVRVSRFELLGGFSEDRDMSGSEDWLFLTRLALSGEVQFVPRVATIYRQHGGNTTPACSLRSIDRSIEAIIPDIVSHYAKQGRRAVKRIKRQAEYKKVGSLNSHGHPGEASRILRSLFAKDYVALVDYRSYRLSLSILRAAVSYATTVYWPGEKFSLPGTEPEANPVTP